MRLRSPRFLLAMVLLVTLFPGLQGALASARIGKQSSRVAGSKLLPGTPLFSVGYIDGYIGPKLIARLKDGALRFTAGQPLQVNGWAVDSFAHTVAGGVFITIDGRRSVRAQYGQDRPDVARILHNPAYRRSGFTGMISTRDFALGAHTLRLQILAARGRGYYAPGAGIPFVLTRDLSLASLTKLPGSATYAIGVVGGYVGSALIAREKRGPLLTAADRPLLVNGWAVDSAAHSVAGGVLMTIDGRRSVRAQYGQDRPDVARVLRAPAYRRSGFTAIVPARWLAHGRHVLRFELVTHDLIGYYEPPQGIAILVR